MLALKFKKPFNPKKQLVSSLQISNLAKISFRLDFLISVIKPIIKETEVEQPKLGETAKFTEKLYGKFTKFVVNLKREFFKYFQRKYSSLKSYFRPFLYISIIR